MRGWKTAGIVLLLLAAAALVYLRQEGPSASHVPEQPRGRTARPQQQTSPRQQQTASNEERSQAGIAIPPEQREEIARTLQAIATNGPFPFRRDGIVFQNREGLLPRRASGYYHEYTVRTPGAGDRGARRIVTGSGGETWYSPDHYRSFVAIPREGFR